MNARVPGFLGMSGFAQDDTAVYQSAINVGLGETSGFSGLVAVSLVGAHANGGNPQMLFGNTSDGTSDGWFIARLDDTDAAADVQALSTYRVYLRTGGSLLAASGFRADMEDRLLLIGFTYNGSNAFTTWVNGAQFDFDATNTFVRPTGTRLRLGGSNGIVSVDNAQDTIAGALYDSSLISAANMVALFGAFRATGSLAGAVAEVGLDIDIVYDFSGKAPALPAPTVTNSGTLVGADLTYAGGSAFPLTPKVVPNELVSQFVPTPPG